MSDATDLIIDATLEPHRGNLVDQAPAQLRALWRAEFAGMPASTVRELVNSRLASGEYSHFRKPSPGQAAPGQPAAANARGTAAAAAAERPSMIDQLKASVARANGGNVLAGGSRPVGL